LSAQTQDLVGGLIAEVARVVPLDHLDRRAAVIGETLDVVASLQGRRDERVTGGVELPWPNPRRAKSAVPMLLDEAFFVDGPPVRCSPWFGGVRVPALRTLVVTCLVATCADRNYNRPVRGGRRKRSYPTYPRTPKRVTFS